MKNKPGRVRITGGELRSRRIQIASVPGLRPTGDRAREVLFNWLGGRIAGRRCLDLFAGSGVLGLEALSRNAQKVCFVESHPRAQVALTRTIRDLDVAERCEVFRGQAERFLQREPRSFDLIFLDPPFDADLLQQTIDALLPHWVAEEGHVYVESEPGTPLEPGRLELIRESQLGDVWLRLYYNPPVSPHLNA